MPKKQSKKKIKEIPDTVYTVCLELSKEEMKKSLDNVVLELQRLAVNALDNCRKFHNLQMYKSEANSYMVSLYLINREFITWYTDEQDVLETYIGSSKIDKPIMKGEYKK